MNDFINTVLSAIDTAKAPYDDKKTMEKVDRATEKAIELHQSLAKENKQNEQ